MRLVDMLFLGLGGIITLFSFYVLGKKDKENETNKKLIDVAKKSKRVDSMSFNNLVKRMQEYNDK
jgi:hypothetical protein